MTEQNAGPVTLTGENAWVNRTPSPANASMFGVAAGDDALYAPMWSTLNVSTDTMNTSGGAEGPHEQPMTKPAIKQRRMTSPVTSADRGLRKPSSLSLSCTVPRYDKVPLE
jgi:hypothetical protein